MFQVGHAVEWLREQAQNLLNGVWRHYAWRDRADIKYDKRDIEQVGMMILDVEEILSWNHNQVDKHNILINH